MKRIINILLTIGIVLLVGGSSSIYAQKGVKKVLILDFANGGGGAKVDFFHTTGSDILNEKLLTSRKFEIISKAKMKKAIKKLKISKNQIHLKKNAIRIAELVEADIVISGVYKTAQNNYMFTINVYHMKKSDEKKDFKEETKGSLKNSVFAAMDNLSNKVVKRVDRTTSVSSSGKTEARRFSGYTRFNPVIDVYFSGAYISTFNMIGLGTKVNWQPPPLGKSFHTYYEFEAIKLDNGNSYDSTWYVSISYFGYIIPIQMGGNFVLSPYILLGEYFISENSSATMDGPVVKTGANARFYFGKSFGVAVDASIAAPMLSNMGSGFFSSFIGVINVSLGVTYRIK
ncbi:MAG: hypothetical protein ABUK01_01285 [Leptospirales bacterium]